MQETNAVIISIHPEHANKILSGEKNLEFRRVWASKAIETVIIYASSPIKKIVALASVRDVHYGSPNKLWEIAKAKGGGLSRRKLYKYFNGKKNGYAIEFESVNNLSIPIIPTSIFETFHPPQSFAYIEEKYIKLIKEFSMNKKNDLGKVIFVSGVHGVGKTSMCEPYKHIPEFIHKSASELIREAKTEAIKSDSKAVQDIDGNQELLIRAVSKIRTSGKNLLLDGHFAIWDATHQPVPIDTKVFSSLNIDAIITIHDDPYSIATRTKQRDNLIINESDIDALQKLELNRAKQVSNELNIPFTLLKAFDQNAFETAIKN